MEPIATLPVFFKLGGKRAVLAGGDAPAVWKADLLAAAGAHVDVYAADPCDDLVALAGGAIALHRRPWAPDDLVGAAIALGAIEAEDEAEAFVAAARRAGVPVNVIDKPAFCDFQFGAIVTRSPLVIGISTDGAAPVLGQAIRTRIESLLPAGLTAWAEAARDWRPAVQSLGLDFRRRRQFWEAFAARALGAQHPPTEEDRDACLGAAAHTGPQGSLTLVGAGDGTPDGVTMRAVAALQTADEIFHAASLRPSILALGRREARRITIPDGLSPDEAASMVVAALDPARVTVWVDRGDPRACLVWRARLDGLADRRLTPTLIPGLGPCGLCRTGCPSFTLPGAEGSPSPPP